MGIYLRLNQTTGPSSCVCQFRYAILQGLFRLVFHTTSTETWDLLPDHHVIITSNSLSPAKHRDKTKGRSEDFRTGTSF